MKKFFCLLLFFSFIILFANADINPVLSREKHFKSINTLIKTSNGYISSGDDGYVIEWDSSFTGKHYQLSPMEIKLAVKNPAKNELAIYETDGYSVYRLSVWNLDKYELKYSHRFTDSITFLNYSANGRYLITGTTAVDGLIFLDSNSGSPLEIFEEEISTPLLAKTNKSESTSIVYSSNGILFYGDMRTGSEKASIDTSVFLEKPVLFSNNMYLAGISYDGIHVINAVSGEELCLVNSENPFLLCEASDKDLYYCEYNKAENCYEIKIVYLQKPELNYIPLVINTFLLENKDEVSCIIKNNSNILIGSKMGMLYQFSTVVSNQKAMLSPLTESAFLPVIDAVTFKDKMILLTKENIYQSEIEKDDIIKIEQNTGRNLNVVASDDYVILWTKNEKDSLYMLSLTNDSVKNAKIYSPEKPVNTLHIKNNKIISIEGNSSLVLFDLEKKKKTNVYNGTGLQDAILISDGKKESIIIAKSSTTAPKSSLIELSLDTKETVPLPLTSDIVLTLNQNVKNSVFYGISNTSQENIKKTEIFYYNLEKKSYTPVSYWTDEDTDVFIELFNDYLITNIGKNSVRAINLLQKKESIMQRQNALTKKVFTNKDYIIFLNTDYSISIFDSKSKYLESRRYKVDLETIIRE